MPAIMTKLPDNAVQYANLTVINGVSQKFYQVYAVEKTVEVGSLTGTAKYDVVTAHGRIGHTPKYLVVVANVSLIDVQGHVSTIMSNKKKKGYVANALNVIPTTLLPSTVLKTTKTVTNKKLATNKPILMMPTITAGSPVISKMIPQPVITKPKKKNKFNRLGNLF